MRGGRPVDRAVLERLAGALHHRGPDSRGFHVDGPVGLVDTLKAGATISNLRLAAAQFQGRYESVVGSLASQNKGTLVGDTVNLSQRLQDLARPAGTTVVSDATVTAVGGAVGPYRFELIGQQLVKGRETPVTMHRLVDSRTDLRDDRGDDRRGDGGPPAGGSGSAAAGAVTGPGPDSPGTTTDSDESMAHAHQVAREEAS